MMTRTFAIISCGLSCLLLNACTNFSYSKPNVTQQSFAADQSRCNVEANVAASGTESFTRLAIFKQNKDMCMVGRGYTTICDGSPCDPQY